MLSHSKHILDRNRVVGFPMQHSAIFEKTLKQKIHNPYRPVTAKNLIRLLFYLHERKGWTVGRQFNTYYPEAKALIEKVGKAKAEALMIEASGKAKHPWGFAFVNRLGELSNDANKRQVYNDYFDQSPFE